MTIEKETKENNHSFLTLISFSVITFGSGVTYSFFTAYGLYFYEVEVGLPILLYTLATIIFAIWDAVNDPIIGYITDKPRFYTKRWGRRFPWIVFGAIPITILFLFVFAPPDVDVAENSLLIFFWLTLFLCAYEWFYTALSVNHYSLYPQKFRSNRDRRFINGIKLVMSGAMTFFGMIFPPLIIVYGDKSSFFTAALILVFISIPLLILGIPGNREDKELIEGFLNSEKDQKKASNFLQVMKTLLKNRNFIAMIAIWICLNSYSYLAMGSVIYYTRYVLQLEVFWASFIMLAYILTGLITIPFWIWIIGKIGEIKTIYIGMIGMALSMIPIILFRNVYITIIASGITGIVVCALQCSDEPLYASVIDDVVLKERRRREGTYGGVKSLITRVSGPFTTLIFAITHIITGFNPFVDTQTSIAQWGIIADLALVPMILSALSVVLFWKLWRLTERDRIDLRVKMRELNL